jgi:cytoskeleton protein RodZ
MSSGQLDQAEASVRAAEGPGQRLRQARLAQGLEIARVANQLHLSEAVVEALEREDFARIPPVFVKGYIANYGRLLGLPADPLLAAYARLQPELERSAEPVPRSKPMPKRLGGGNRLGYLLSGLILLGILAAGGYWVMTRLQPGEGVWQVPETALDNAEEPAEELPPSLQALLEKAPEPEPAFPEPPPGESAEPTPASTEDRPAPTVQRPATPVPIRPAAVPEPAVVTEPSITESAGVGAEAEGPPQVVLELLGSCWVDIRDANGKNKIIGELTKGARRTLEGKPPFSVVLGNSRAVRILIDGAPYDIGQHARGNVARFKLDPRPIAPEG